MKLSEQVSVFLKEDILDFQHLASKKKKLDSSTYSMLIDTRLGIEVEKLILSFVGSWELLILFVNK